MLWFNNTWIQQARGLPRRCRRWTSAWRRRTLSSRPGSTGPPSPCLLSTSQPCGLAWRFSRRRCAFVDATDIQRQRVILELQLRHEHAAADDWIPWHPAAHILTVVTSIVLFSSFASLAWSLIFRVNASIVCCFAKRSFNNGKSFFIQRYLLKVYYTKATNLNTAEAGCTMMLKPCLIIMNNHVSFFVRVTKICFLL